MTIGLDNKNTGKRGKIRIPWYSVLFWLLPFLGGQGREGVLPFLSALLHELGHYGAACALGVRVEAVTVYPFGADMRLSPGLRSYGSDWLIAAAGSAVNLLLAGVGCAVGSTMLIACNLALAVVNLLPVKGLDGGTMLLALAGLCGFRGERLVKITSLIGLFFLWLWAVYLLLLADGDPSLLLLVCGLFASIFLRRRP